MKVNSMSLTQCDGSRGQHCTLDFTIQMPSDWAKITDSTAAISSVPTLCEQNQLVVGNRLNFVAHRLCK